MATERTRKSAPGPFYVVADLCTACGTPAGEAPDLMGFDDLTRSCYFRRQPSTPEDTYRAVRVLWSSCCGAHRYGGTDELVIARLAELGLEPRADHVPAVVPPRAIRDQVTFAFDDRGATAGTIVATVRFFIVHGPKAWLSEPSLEGERVALVYNWADMRAGVTLEVHPSPEGDGRWQLALTPTESSDLVAVAVAVDDALRACNLARDLRWSTPAERRAGGLAWSALPI